MRAVVVVFVQILISLFLTATIMPLVLVTTPAAQANGHLGLALMGGVLLVSFTLVALVWPRRLR